MSVRLTTFTYPVLGCLIGVLSACSQAPNYAPVKTVNQTVRPPSSGPEIKGDSAAPHTEARLSEPAISPRQQNVAVDRPHQSTGNLTEGKVYRSNHIRQELNKTVDKKQIASKSPSSDVMHNAVQKQEKTNRLQRPSHNNQDKSETVTNKKSDPAQKNTSKNTINNAITKNPTMLASGNISGLDRKAHEKVLTDSKKRKEEKSIISIDNKKVLKLKFGWPMEGKLSKNFAQTDQKGIDITGKHGQSVRAAESGKAVYCGQGLKGFGKLIVIKHDETYLSAYANNSKLYITEGQQIKKGQIIGQVGVSGLKKSSLHFEIRKNGKPINPLSLLPNQ